MNLVEHPLLLLLVSFIALWAAALLGAFRFERLRSRIADFHDNFSLIQGATLTLLGLVIAFVFSMAVGRYDQRKNYEEEEANAIGTEYLRADLLPAADATRVRKLLVGYLDQRVQFYLARDDDALVSIGSSTANLESELWAAVRAPATAQPNPVTALAVTGMNDVINTQGYTQAAWLNRIPRGAWILMLLIAMGGSMLVGMGSTKAKGSRAVLVVLPLVVSVAFFLIADIDSPRGGVIPVSPQNLLALAQSLRGQ